MTLVVQPVYTDDAVVKGIAISLLLMAAIFQVADGVQIGAAGAHCAATRTRGWPMVINTFAYWVLAFPLAYLAAVTYQHAAQLHLGRFCRSGLRVAAVLLTWRYIRLSKRALESLPVVMRK